MPHDPSSLLAGLFRNDGAFDGPFRIRFRRRSVTGRRGARLVQRLRKNPLRVRMDHGVSPPGRAPVGSARGESRYRVSLIDTRNR